MTVGCRCGDWSGVACDWIGPHSETVVVEYMPSEWRESHTEARNRGHYPGNGAQRIRVSLACADRTLADDGEWCERVVSPDPDLDLTPLSAGFDPRVHGMVCALPATARRVRYDADGETREVSGTTEQIVAALEAAGYTTKVTS